MFTSTAVNTAGAADLPKLQWAQKPKRNTTAGAVTGYINAYQSPIGSTQNTRPVGLFYNNGGSRFTPVDLSSFWAMCMCVQAHAIGELHE